MTLFSFLVRHIIISFIGVRVAVTVAISISILFVVYVYVSEEYAKIVDFILFVQFF